MSSSSVRALRNLGTKPMARSGPTRPALTSVRRKFTAVRPARPPKRSIEAPAMRAPCAWAAVAARAAATRARMGFDTGAPLPRRDPGHTDFLRSPPEKCSLLAPPASRPVTRDADFSPALWGTEDTIEMAMPDDAQSENTGFRMVRLRPGL